MAIWQNKSVWAGTFSALLVSIAIVAGCKKPGDNPGGPSATPPKEVRLGYFANVTHAQAVLGVHSGDFEKAVAPAKFSSKFFNAGPELIEALNGGNIDIGYIGPGPALNGFTKSGGKMVRVISGSAGNGVVIVARPGSGISSLTDLKNRAIGTPQLANTQDIAARAYLLSHLKQPKAENVKPTRNAEQATRMQAKEIDASWAPEPWGAYLEAKAGATVIAEEKDIKELWPEGKFGITYVITTPKFLQEHPDIVEKVLTAHVTWTDRLRTEPEKWQPDLEAALGKLTNTTLPPGVLSKAMKRTLFTDDAMEHTFTRNAQWTYTAGFAEDLPQTSGLVDTTILKKVRSAHPATAPVQ
jgi:NitT/TauT family transport system substrate-binding protein